MSTPALLIHQRGGGMPQFMSGIILRAVYLLEIPFDNVMDALQADSFVETAEKQRVFILDAIHGAHLQVLPDGVLASLVQIQEAFFVAFTAHPQGIVPADVLQIQTSQFRPPQAAVE